MPALKAPLWHAGDGDAAGARRRWRRRWGTPAVEAPLWDACCVARRRWRRRCGTREAPLWHDGGGADERVAVEKPWSSTVTLLLMDSRSLANTGSLYLETMVNL